jgi:hypothetical protein
MKQAVSRVWSVVEVYVRAVSFLLALLCVFVVATPQASAATTLTRGHIEAISALLLSINVDQETIDRVRADLLASQSFTGVQQPLCNPANRTVACLTPTTTLPTLPTAPTSTPLCNPMSGMVACITPTTTASSFAPTCTLTANRTSLDAHGGSVILTWTSRNATSASTKDGGVNDKVNGSITLDVRETTQFIKRVYGPGGSGGCSVTVEVGGVRSATTKVVWNPLPGLNQLLGEMQLGAVVVAETLGIVEPSW